MVKDILIIFISNTYLAYNILIIYVLMYILCDCWTISSVLVTCRIWNYMLVNLLPTSEKFPTMFNVFHVVRIYRMKPHISIVTFD